MNILEQLFTHDIRSVTPRIVELQEPILIIGMGVDTDLKNVFRDIPALGKRFEKQKRAIPNKREPWGFAAVSQGLDKAKGAFRYFMGDRVTTIAEVPEGLTALEIPTGKYVVFPIRPKNRLGWPVAIGSAKRYIYEAWLPNSCYEPGGAIDDFEYHDERSIRKGNPEIDLYVAVR